MPGTRRGPAQRTLWVLLGCVPLVCGPAPTWATGEPGSVERPNVVLLIGDDHGFPYFGFTGNRDVHTPNLDELARGGTMFSFAHDTASVCAPSLNSLLTGLYPSQWHRLLKELRVAGQHDVRRRNAIRLVDTLPRVLGRVGYVSFQAGKFWEGPYALAGFTAGTVATADAAIRGGDQAFGRTTIQPVLDFIDRNAERPFFVWFAPMLPHAPFDAPDEYHRIYREQNLPARLEAYYANCSWFDDLAGKFLRHLESRGLRERTLVVYLSDNGWDPFASGDVPNKGKATMHELGFRTPLLFNWPGHVPGGVVSDRLVSTVDVFPTLSDYAGVAVPPGRLGIDLRPVIEGRGAPERDALIGMMLRPGKPDGIGREQGDASASAAKERAYYLTDREWHYVWYASLGRDVLYDKKRDPQENRDVSSEQPERVAELRARVQRWEDEVSSAVAIAVAPTPSVGSSPGSEPSTPRAP